MHEGVSPTEEVTDGEFRFVKKIFCVNISLQFVPQIEEFEEFEEFEEIEYVQLNSASFNSKKYYHGDSN
jgi:hypothetical protein